MDGFSFGAVESGFPSFGLLRQYGSDEGSDEGCSISVPFFGAIVVFWQPVRKAKCHLHHLTNLSGRYGTVHEPGKMGKKNASGR